MHRYRSLTLIAVVAGLFAGCTPQSAVVVDRSRDDVVIVRSTFALADAADAARHVARGQRMEVHQERTQRGRNEVIWLTTPGGSQPELQLQIRPTGGGSATEIAAVNAGTRVLALDFADRLAERLRALESASRQSEVRVQTGRTTSF